jgi:hypothetical protein
MNWDGDPMWYFNGSYSLNVLQHQQTGIAGNLFVDRINTTYVTSLDCIYPWTEPAVTVVVNPGITVSLMQRYDCSSPKIVIVPSSSEHVNQGPQDCNYGFDNNKVVINSSPGLISIHASPDAWTSTCLGDDEDNKDNTSWIVAIIVVTSIVGAAAVILGIVFGIRKYRQVLPLIDKNVQSTYASLQ